MRLLAPRLNRESHISGAPHWALTEGDMALDPGMLNGVCRITSAGDLIGTGFLVGVPSEAIPGKRWGYVLTADHVVHNEVAVAVEVPDPRNPGKLYEPVPIPKWEQPCPPADLAMAPFPLEKERDWKSMRLDMDVLYPSTPMALAEPLHYLGMFAPWDIPMARTGTTAVLGFPYDQFSKQKQKRYAYKSHLVDCRSYGGFSGSPCFIRQDFAIVNERVPTPEHAPLKDDGTPKELAPIGYQTLLAGLFTAHVSDEGDMSNPLDLVSRYGIGIMLSVDYIWEALMSDDAKQERRKRDRDHLASAPQPPIQQVAVGSANPEYDAFEQLTKQLVNTPKTTS
jgi:hypothetical protein